MTGHVGAGVGGGGAYLTMPERSNTPRGFGELVPDLLPGSPWVSEGHPHSAWPPPSSRQGAWVHSPSTYWLPSTSL